MSDQTETERADIAAVIGTVRADTRALNISKLELARRAGLHRATLLRFYNDDWNPRAKTLGKLEVAIREFRAEMQTRTALFPVPE